MIAVSNTTPLRYLIAIKPDDLLGQLFSKVLVPSAVHRELTEARTPEDVRRRILSLPEWLEVRQSPTVDSVTFPLALHRGEREAILLAEAIGCDVLLIDEQAGRTVALARNLPVSGTLGVLEQADRIGLIEDFSSTLDQLIASGFFIGESLREQLLERHRARHFSK